LTNHLKNEQNKNASLTQQTNQLQQKIAQQEKTVDKKLGSVSDEFQIRITNLEQRLAEAKEEVESSQKEIKSLAYTNSILTRDLNTLQKENNDLKNQKNIAPPISSTNQQLTTQQIEEIKLPLQTSIRFMEKRLLDADAQLQDKEQKILELKKEIETLRSQNSQ